MNKVMLLGRLGADAELKVMSGGKSVLKFSLATSEKYTDRDGNKQEKTEWHRCNLWGERAEKLAKYLTKGKQLLVEGSIQYGKYEKDGVTQYTTDIRVNNLEFIADGNGRKDTAQADDHGLPAVGDDEIPF